MKKRVVQTQAVKNQENSSPWTPANSGHLNPRNDFFLHDNRPETIEMRKIHKRRNERNLQCSIQLMDNRPKEITQLMMAGYVSSGTSGENTMIQRIAEIEESTNDNCGPNCGFVALYAAFKYLISTFADIYSWDKFMRDAPHVAGSHETEIFDVNQMIKVIASYRFKHKKHHFTDGAELVTAIKKTGTNPVLIPHTLVGIKEREYPDSSQIVEQRTHWSIITSEKDGILTLWDNWVNEKDTSAYGNTYQIESQELAKKKFNTKRQRI
ncbi:MAG: hypothetical protein AAGA66_08030 [Bacteroidota bacterium]